MGTWVYGCQILQARQGTLLTSLWNLCIKQEGQRVPAVVLSTKIKRFPLPDKLKRRVCLKVSLVDFFHQTNMFVREPLDWPRSAVVEIRVLHEASHALQE